MPNRDVQDIALSTGTILRFFLILLGLFVLYIIRDVVAALLFAVIIASAVEPAVEWLKKRRVPRILGVILIYLSVVLAVFLLVYLVVPLFIEDVRGVSLSYPLLRERVGAALERVRAIPFLESFDFSLEKIFLIPSEVIERAGGGVLQFASTIFGGAFTLLLIVVFSFYLAAQEKGIENFLRLVTPLRHEQYLIDLWGRSQRKLGRWFRAQLLLGVVVGVFTFLGLTFLGVSHALFFALLSAAFEIIPIVGPILAAVPAVIVAFFLSPLTGLATLILYAAIQQIESHVIVPVVMRKAVGLSPLVVVLALLVGGKLGGILGILLAVPITAIAAEFLEDWDKKKRALLPG